MINNSKEFFDPRVLVIMNKETAELMIGVMGVNSFYMYTKIGRKYRLVKVPQYKCCILGVL